jgi:3-hydroxybutyrate dehydrogenase
MVTRRVKLTMPSGVSGIIVGSEYSMSLRDKVALVTGGGRGIGRAIALALAEAGADVAVAARSEAQLRQVAGEIMARGRRGLAVTCDVAEKDQIHRAVEAVRARLGPVDILVNNAGITVGSKTIDMDDDLWDYILRVNVTGAYLCSKAVLPAMLERGWGRIINIGSTYSRVGRKYTAAYCASKHALLGFTRALALEMAEHHITVNAICPGWVETDMAEAAIENIVAKTGRSPEEARAALEQVSPQKRLIQPEEVARVAVMLAGEGAAGITGQAIHVDGGTFMA